MPPIRKPGACGTTIEFVALQAIFHHETLECFRGGVVPGQAVVGAHPQPAIFILENPINGVAGQTIFGGQTSETVFGHIETVEAVFGAKPHEALVVLGDTRNDALTKTIFDGQL